MAGDKTVSDLMRAVGVLPTIAVDAYWVMALLYLSASDADYSPALSALFCAAYVAANPPRPA